MPVTPAHAIAVWPLWKASGRRLPLDALVIGSCVPDLPYFLHLHPVRAPGHTFPGVLTYDLPFGILLLLVWRFGLREPISRLFTLRAPRSAALGARASTIPLTLLALTLGALTHVLWDATSHGTGMIVQRVPALEDIVLGLPVYKWIQFGSGILGLACLGWLALRTRDVRPDLSGPGQTRLWILAFVTLGGPALALSLFAAWRFGTGSLENVLVHLVTGGIAGLGCGALLYGLLYRLQPRWTTDLEEKRRP